MFKKLIAVASGKGGVGKSTVSGMNGYYSGVFIIYILVNLALSLAKEKKRVGLLDADLFGPSLPRMMNLSGPSARPVLTAEKRIKPVLAYGIECMSMGLIQASGSVVWRGLMVQKAIEQLLFQVQWSDLDYLVVDLPPGTGDTQLTLCQKASIDGVLLVTTPQEVAISDARKAADMFKLLKVPIWGIVENMSSFCCPNCNTSSPIFAPSRSKSALKAFSEAISVPVIAQLPIDPLVCSGSDDGSPVVLSHPDHIITSRFKDIAQFIINKDSG